MHRNTIIHEKFIDMNCLLGPAFLFCWIICPAVQISLIHLNSFFNLLGRNWLWDVLFYGFSLFIPKVLILLMQKVIVIWLNSFYLVWGWEIFYSCANVWSKNCLPCRIHGTSFRIVVENEEQVELSFLRTWNASLEGNYVPLNIDKRSLLKLDMLL